MATATYIGVLFVSLDEQLVDPADTALCGGGVRCGGGARFDSKINFKTFCSCLNQCDSD